MTMIEILVVLAIIGLALSVMPAILTGLDGNRLRAAALEMVATMREARSRATMAEAETDMALDLERRGYTLSTDRVFRPLPAAVGALEVAPAALIGPERIARIRFLPDGSATAARITLRSGERRATITVNGLTGQVARDG